MLFSGVTSSICSLCHVYMSPNSCHVTYVYMSLILRSYVSVSCPCITLLIIMSYYVHLSLYTHPHLLLLRPHYHLSHITLLFHSTHAPHVHTPRPHIPIFILNPHITLHLFPRPFVTSKHYLAPCHVPVLCSSVTLPRCQQQINDNRTYVDANTTLHEVTMLMDSNPIRTALEVCKQLVSRSVREIEHLLFCISCLYCTNPSFTITTTTGCISKTRHDGDRSRADIRYCRLLDT